METINKIEDYDVYIAELQHENRELIIERDYYKELAEDLEKKVEYMGSPLYRRRI